MRVTKDDFSCFSQRRIDTTKVWSLRTRVTAASGDQLDSLPQVSQAQALETSSSIHRTQEYESDPLIQLPGWLLQSGRKMLCGEYQTSLMPKIVTTTERIRRIGSRWYLIMKTFSTATFMMRVLTPIVILLDLRLRVIWSQGAPPSCLSQPQPYEEMKMSLSQCSV